MIPMHPKAITIQQDFANLMAAMRFVPEPSIALMSPSAIFLLACIGDEEVMPAIILHRNYWIGRNPATAIAALVKAGLAEVNGNPNSRRSILIKLTAEGLRIAARIRAILAQQYEPAEVNRDLPADEKERLAQQSQQPSGNGVAGH